MIAKDFKNDIVLVLPPPGWQKPFRIGLGFCAAYLKRMGFHLSYMMFLLRWEK